VSGTTAAIVSVEVKSVAGTVSVPTTVGVTVDPASTASDLFLSGAEADLDTALAGLAYTRTDVAVGSVTVSTGADNEFVCAATGHVYVAVATPVDWNTAFTDSAAMFNGNGYLATVTSDSENSCIFDGVAALTGEGRNTWIGGQLVPGGQVLDWEWADGPEVGQTFWTGGQNGQAASGSYANFDRTDGPQPQSDPGQPCAQYYNAGNLPTWHDNGCGASNKYVVEVDAALASLPAASVSFAAIVPTPVAPVTATPAAGLAATGANATGAVGVGVLFLIFGVVLVLVRRRRSIR
jgi:hypothetical protein